MVNIYSAPIANLKELKNVFIELTAKNCNQKCKHCYIDFPISKNTKDFISVEKIKNELPKLNKTEVQCIYLTGAEPMTHPDFNTILRLCLKFSPTCICTNGSFINEKKARFLKKVEDEGDNEIIFRLSIDHFNEIKNDDIRSRGSYRQVLNAIKNLIKYDFSPILSITNYYHEPQQVLIEGFNDVCNKIGFETTKINFQISEYYDKYKQKDFEINSNSNLEMLDCVWGRTLTENGIYSCPFLANDHRGWVGSSFNDFSKKVLLESNYCMTCTKNKNKMFALNL